MRMNKLWEEAKISKNPLPQIGGGEFILVRGVRILNINGDISIYNTKKGGGFYKEISAKEYDEFLKYGFYKGVAIVSLSNIKISLDRINNEIMYEVSDRKNPKRRDSLISKRNEIMIKYNKLKKEINL